MSADLPAAGAADPAQRMSRRQLIRHSAWFGSAVVLTFTGTEVVSHIAGMPGAGGAGGSGVLRFAQVSDSHLGFTGSANTDVAASFGTAIAQVNSLGYEPDFVMHSGDLTHLSTAAQFDQVRHMAAGLRTPRVFTVPGEHDSFADGGRMYRRFFGAGTRGDGWYSFDIKGVHVISLVNAAALDALGHLGHEQLDFVRKDVAGLSSDTPVIVFSHIPLFAMYPTWGWSTSDAAQLLAMLRRFASVTCLNGHVHQLFVKTEGNVTFHSATTTAYPLPAPGADTAPVPVTLPAGTLYGALGIRTVTYQQGMRDLAIVDEHLE